MDDPSPTSDAAVETRIIEVFAQHGVPLTVGVIPFREKNGKRFVVSPDATPHLVSALEAGTIEIALHGYSHLQRATGSDGSPSEFSGIPASEQFDMIAEALAALNSLTDGVAIRGFVPPWNTYDRSTAAALHRLGFEYVSPSLRGSLINHPGLQVLPATGSLGNARRVIEQAVHLNRFSPTAIIYFHPDDFYEYPNPPRPGEKGPFISLEDLDQLLRWARQIKAISVTSLNAISQELNDKSMRLWPPQKTLASLTPRRFRHRFPRHVLFNSKTASIAAGVASLVRKGKSLDRTDGEVAPETGTSS